MAEVGEKPAKLPREAPLLQSEKMLLLLPGPGELGRRHVDEGEKWIERWATEKKRTHILDRCRMVADFASESAKTGASWGGRHRYTLHPMPCLSVS